MSKKKDDSDAQIHGLPKNKADNREIRDAVVPFAMPNHRPADWMARQTLLNISGHM
jgi:hypothetical protein